MSMDTSRRDMLRLLLGAPLAAAACQRGLPARNIPGEIRGGNFSLGHRLREATLEQASGPVKQLGVAIIGAGPSGLSAGWRLERQGYTDFTIFELEGQAGGTSAYGQDGVVPYPWGAHYVPVPTQQNPALVQLLTEMDVLEPDISADPMPLEQHRIRAVEERLYLDGAWHEGLFPHYGASEQDFAELKRFEAQIAHWVEFRDERGRRAFALPMALSSDAAEVKALDKLSALDWLKQHGIHSPRVHWYVEYACRDDYGLSLAHTSAWAMLFYYCSRVRRAGEESAPFVTWPEGNGRLVRYLTEVVGERLRLGQLVTDIAPHENHVEFSVYSAATGLQRYQAKQLILALPKFIAKRILRPLRESKALDSFTYGVWMVANLHLKHRPKSSGFESAWDNVIYDSPALGYVVASHQTLRDRGPTVWTYYHPFVDADPKQARERLLGADYRGLSDSIVADLGRAHHGLSEAIERIDIWRWGHAMIRPTPGFIWGPEREKARESIGRVHFAHSDLSGVALFEEAQYWGVQAADHALRGEGREPTPFG